MISSVLRRPVISCLLLALAGNASGGDAARSADVALPPRIALIIDDLGNAADSGRRAAELPGPVACAVLPATPRARLVAELAVANGKEVLLHLPLQAEDKHAGGDPGALSLDMSRARFAELLRENLESVPHVIGVNNHRGSLLTRHPGHMQWLMQELKARNNLFFIDSYTTRHSVALQLARETGVPAARRDVFLDDTPTPEAIAAQFERLKRIARRDGSAIGIGHPHAVTLAFLEEALPRLAADGFELVRLEELLEPATGPTPVEPAP